MLVFSRQETAYDVSACLVGSEKCISDRQYDVHFVVRDSILLNNRFTLSTSKVNVDDVLRDLEAVSSITLPMASISFPSVMNLVWGLGWSGLPIVLPYSILVRRKREKTDIPILIGSVSPINNKRRGITFSP